jgi:hypothetical protein
LKVFFFPTSAHGTQGSGRGEEKDFVFSADSVSSV